MAFFSPAPRSLHWLLWQAIALACLPVLLMAFVDFRARRQDAIEALEREVASVLLAARLGQEASLRHLQQSFDIMARADNLRRLDAQDCSGLVRRLLRSMPDLSDLGAVRPDGRLFCSTTYQEQDAPLTVNDLGWFRDALSASGMTAGELLQTSAAAPAQLVFGYPVRSRSGELQAVLYAAMAPARFAQLASALPAGWNAFLLGPQGQVLSDLADDEQAFAAEHVPALARLQAALAAGQRVLELPGRDGARRMYGIAQPQLSRTPLLLAVGAPLARTVGHIEHGFALRVLVLLALALLSMLAARYWVYGLVDAWTRRTTRALQALTAGQLDEPLPTRSRVRELAAVEQGLSDLAAQLRQRGQALQRLSAAVEQSPVAILITNRQEQIEYVNPAFEQLTGYRSADVLGQHPRLLSAGEVPAEVYAHMRAELQAGRVWQGEFDSRRKDGSAYQERVTIAPIRVAGGAISHYVATLQDITGQRQAQAQIHRLAYYDALTGLPNRSQMHACMAQALQECGQGLGAGALLLFDIDRFRQINDAWGHAAGDALLCTVAERLQAAASPQGQVARLGSNTFALLERHLGPDRAATEAAALALAQQVLQQLAQPVALPAGQRLYASASGGIALLCAGAADAAQLLKQAEVALYRAEAAGGNSVLLFDAALQSQVDARATLEMGLRQALQDRGFVLHYQAQVDARGHVTGAEVLLRWPHGPQGRPVSPAQFIPLAEDTGLIVPLGQWVLDSACAQLARWQAQAATAQLTLSVNVSARQFHQGDFADQVAAALARHQVPPNRLVLELTESAILGGLEATAARMHALRALGLRFALDDFGTGYSSLSYLQQLPFDELKIDQSFTRAMLQDPASSAIVRAILMMSRALGLAVIAEGVETAAHHDFLLRHDCQGCQGYWFGRPMALADWERQHLQPQAADGAGV
ncbi:MAG: EAL domain-containing protein [Comamonadaceae bacterium]|nr:EAL domain-containing protein [Comamonadaceae bacterium]